MHPKYISSPVDIVKAQPYDFCSPQAICCQQHQDRIIAKPVGERSVRVTSSHLLYFLRSQCRRNTFVIVDAWTDDRCHSDQLGVPATMQMAQEVSEADRAVLDEARPRPAQQCRTYASICRNAQAPEGLFGRREDRESQELAAHALCVWRGSPEQPAQVSKPRVIVRHPRGHGERLRARCVG